MRALRLTAWKSDPEMMEVPDPHPGPGEVVVRIGGAGACHSDLHLLHEFEPGLLPWELPFTLGHENAGWVAELGEGVHGFEIGQPVAVYGAWGCGACPRCLQGLENYCENQGKAPVIAGGSGLGLDGGMAEYLLVPAARHLVPLPDGLTPVHAASLTDAGLTPYHAIRRSWPKLMPGSSAVVIGVGGLGHLAIQILKATTAAQVIAIDPRAEARQLALRVGADHALDPGPTTGLEVRDLASGRGADAVFDFVGSDATIALGAMSARQMGDLTIVGLAGGTFPLSFFGVPYEVSIQTTYWGSRPELVEILDLGARGLVRPTITEVPLDEAADGYRRLAAGQIEGRLVVVP